MPTATTRGAALRAGLIQGSPFYVVVFPFALVFGIVAADAGLTDAQAMGFSVLVVAGASQFAALGALHDGAPIWVALVTALAVNLRMMMYSAALVPHLGPAPLWQRALVSLLLFDQPYALSVLRYEDHPEMTLGDKVAYFMAIAVPLAVLWVLATWIGLAVGSRVPEGWALDFALPITFLGVVAPMLKTPAHLGAAAVSALAALALSGLPSNFGLLIAAVLAMLAGAMIETRRERRASA